MSLVLVACAGDPDAPPPATPSTPQITAGMGFDSYLYDDLVDRNEPCLWFDGYQNKAEQVTVFIYSTDPSGVLLQIYPPQIFRDGKDFYGGNPNGLHFKAPESGGYVMVVRVYGKPNADCCPGPPPGRPVYEAWWPYDEIVNPGYPVVINICRFNGECLYF